MNQQNTEKLKNILQKQLEIADKCCEIVVDIKKSVEKRDYDTLQNLITQFDSSSVNLKQWEQQRAIIFSSLKQEIGLRETATFYDFIAQIDDSENELLNLYRKLKKSVIQMQSSVWVIDSYLKAMTAVLHSVIAQASTVDENLTYGRSGTRNFTNPKSPMILNLSV